MAQFTIALDAEGKKVNIDDAPRRGKYTCINCGAQMMAKKGQMREWHFGHHSITEECNHDSWLHKNIVDLLIARLESARPLIVECPNTSFDLSNNVSFAREKEFEGFFPDILIKNVNEAIFVEIRVTSPCSSEKIASGYKIIEIITSDSRVLDELSSGNIHANAKYYKLEFHNFDDVVKKDETETSRHNTPDILSEESERNISFPPGKKIDMYYGNVLPGKRPVQSKTEIIHCPQREPFNGKHASFFILHSDRTCDVVGRCEFCESDLLVLGINTIADFAMNIGKSYAWRKGLLSMETLTEYEQHIDMPAVIQSFNIVEFKR